MDTRDNIQMVDDQEESVIKRKLRRMFLDWHYYLPIAISVIAAILTICVIIVASLEINQLRSELESLKSGKLAINVTPKTGALKGTTNDATSMANAADSTTTASASSATPSGVAYVRWGRTSCPDDNNLLYSGSSAGASSSGGGLTGGGANMLCLHPEPEWNKYDTQPNDTTGYTWIYSAEFMPFSLGLLPEESHGHNYPCSMCESPRQSKMTVYGRRTCPDGWSREYEGYLMSSSATQTRLMFECIDAAPEYIQGTGNITGGAMMFFVSAYCMGNGALPSCPPYVHARELTCALCTK